MELVTHAEDSPLVRELKRIAGTLMIQDIHERMSLDEAILEMSSSSTLLSGTLVMPFRE